MPSKSHGMARDAEGKRTPEYSAWGRAKQRCYNPKDKGYRNYGALGITMCSRWRYSFAAFLRDMGPRPEGYSLERVDGTRGYYPDNCEWATRTEQNNNIRSRDRRCSKTTALIVETIHSLHQEGKSTRAIADEVGLGKTRVWKILSGGFTTIGTDTDGMCLIRERAHDGQIRNS